MKTKENLLQHLILDSCRTVSIKYKAHFIIWDPRRRPLLSRCVERHISFFLFLCSGVGCMWKLHEFIDDNAIDQTTNLFRGRAHLAE